MIDYFLCELFDVPNPSYITNLPSLLDMDNKKLVYSHVYKHPMMLLNLVFIFCWEECFGITPSKIDCFDAFTYNIEGLDKIFSNIYEMTDVQVMCLDKDICKTFMAHIFKNTFYRFYNTPMNSNYSTNLLNTQEYFNKICSPTSFYNNIDREIRKKLIKRLTPWTGNIKNVEDIPDNNSLFAVFKRCMTQANDDNHNDNEQNIVKKYLSVKAIIKDNDLTIKNIYTNFSIFPLDKKIHKFPIEDWLAINPVECIAHQITHDYYFQRMLLHKHIIHVMDMHDEYGKIFIDILKSSLQDRQKENIQIFGPREYFDVIKTHDDTCILPNNTYFEDSRIFNVCVPQILQVYVCVTKSIQNTFMPFLKTKSITQANMCIIYNGEHIDKNILTNLQNISGFMPIQVPFSYHDISLNRHKYMLPFFYENSIHSPTSLIQGMHTQNINNLASPSPYFREFKYSTHITKDLWDAYVNFEISKNKTTRDILFTSTLLSAKNLILRYVAKRNIKLRDIIDNYNEVYEHNVFSKNIKAPKKKHCIFYLDTRKNISGIYSILITLSNLNISKESPHCWDIVILTPESCRTFYTHYLGPYIRFIDHPLITENDFDIDTYNRIMKSTLLWQQLYDCQISKCLIVQDDSMIFRKGIEQFLDFDYIGPPWLKCASNAPLENYIGKLYVGNGGLSLRSVNGMLKIVCLYKNEKNILFNNSLQPIQEDVYFSMCAQKEFMKLPTYNEASLFGMEQVFNINALGVHKFWVYNNEQKVNLYFDKVINE